MPESHRNKEQAVREMAYFIWEREGRPEGRAQDHWQRATAEAFGQERARDGEVMVDEEKVLACISHKSQVHRGSESAKVLLRQRFNVQAEEVPDAGTV
jgi:hypothetical protein